LEELRELLDTAMYADGNDIGSNAEEIGDLLWRKTIHVTHDNCRTVGFLQTFYRREREFALHHSCWSRFTIREIETMLFMEFFE
jgi:hypothetical protein